MIKSDESFSVWLIKYTLPDDKSTYWTPFMWHQDMGSRLAKEQGIEIVAFKHGVSPAAVSVLGITEYVAAVALV